MAKTYGTVTTFTAGSVLTAAQMNVAGGAINNLVVPAACRVTRAAALSIANNSFVAVNFDTTTYDTDSFVGATKTFLTINTPGIYSITATVGWGAVAAGARGVILALNPTLSGSGDTTTISSTTRIGANFVTGIGSASSQTTQPVCATYSFAANDRISLGVFQSSGGALGIDFTDGFHFALTWIGRTS